MTKAEISIYNIVKIFESNYLKDSKQYNTAYFIELIKECDPLEKLQFEVKSKNDEKPEFNVFYRGICIFSVERGYAKAEIEDLKKGFNYIFEALPRVNKIRKYNISIEDSFVEVMEKIDNALSILKIQNDFIWPKKRGCALISGSIGDFLTHTLGNRYDNIQQFVSDVEPYEKKILEYEIKEFSNSNPKLEMITLQYNKLKLVNCCLLDSEVIYMNFTDEGQEIEDKLEKIIKKEILFEDILDYIDNSSSSNH